MKRRILDIIDNLDRNKVGRVLFGAGIIGFMVSGSCIDSKYWGYALLGVMLSLAVGYIGYGMVDLNKVVKWESRKTRERKQANRARTYEGWIRSTDVIRIK